METMEREKTGDFHCNSVIRIGMLRLAVGKLLTAYIISDQEFLARSMFIIHVHIFPFAIFAHSIFSLTNQTEYAWRWLLFPLRLRNSFNISLCYIFLYFFPEYCYYITDRFLLLLNVMELNTWIRTFLLGFAHIGKKRESHSLQNFDDRMTQHVCGWKKSEKFRG